MKLLSLSFFLFLLGSIVAQSFTPENTWVNLQSDRVLDLTKSYIQEYITLTIKNTDDKPNNEYFYALPSYVYYQLSSFTATNSKNGQELKLAYLDDKSTLINDQPLVNYVKIQLDKPIAPKQSAKLRLKYTVLDLVEPFPAKIQLQDEQGLLLKTFKLPLSSYITESATLKITGIPNGQELAVNGQADVEHQGTVENRAVVYRFKDVEPLMISILPFVYSHNAPLGVVTDLNRGVWVSHWGNTVQFEEFYKLTNNAAELIDGFARVDLFLNRNTMRSTHAIAAMEVTLEEDAQDIYYTDLVGNVSTSRVVGEKLYLKPRYPVYGGWNYNFTIGWTNTLSQFLSKVSSEDYSLTVPLINGPSDVVYDNVDLTFYLPEGAEVVDVRSDFPYVSKSDGYELSFFDLGKGHTAVTLHYEALTDELSHNKVTILYRYNSLAMYSLPLNIAKFAAILLVSYFLLSKVNISLRAK